MNLLELIEEFLIFLEKEKNASKYTLKNYHYYLSYYLEVSKSEDITLASIEEFKDHLSKFKKNTQNYFLIALRSLLKYLREIKGKEVLDPDLINLLKHPQKGIEKLDENILERLISAPDVRQRDGYRDKAIISLILDTGLKISELVSLNKDSINFKEAVLEIKGKKARKLDLSSETLHILESYLLSLKNNFNPLFIRFKGSLDIENQGEKMRLSPRSVERMINKYSRGLNLGESVTPQLLRHQYALNKIDLGEKLSSLQKSLGFNTPSQIKIYT